MRTDERQVRESASSRYAAGKPIWSEADRWNAAKRQCIERFCAPLVPRLVNSDSRVLNAGSGSHCYSWMPNQAVSLDRFPAQLVEMPNPIVGDVEAIPFADSTFNLVVCVGSVLNYASAIEALTELHRVLTRNGNLLLHFESSSSLEHLGTPRWQATAAPLRTLNNSAEDLVWIYSRKFVWRTLERLGLKIVRWRGFHIGSAGLLRLGVGQDRAAWAHRLDQVLWPLRGLADDIILLAQKA